MTLTSNEYCPRCDEMVVVYEHDFLGGTNWVCMECGYTVDTEFHDDDYYGDDFEP